MPVYYKVFHLITDKKIALAKKKYKKFLAGKLESDFSEWMPARIKFSLLMNDLSPRYPHTYICKFIVNRTIPKVVPKSPLATISPMHMIGVLMHKNFWLDPNDRKVQKLFGIKGKGNKTFYNEWDTKVMGRAFRSYLKIDNTKEFTSKNFFVNE